MSSTGTKIVTPLDLEVHVPRDGVNIPPELGQVFYVLDFSRLFPPQAYVETLADNLIKSTNNSIIKRKRGKRKEKKVRAELDE